MAASHSEYGFPFPDELPAPHALPFVTNDLPGIGGRLKAVPDDFRVEEIPAYLPSGHGTHTYFFIEKRGISTRSLIKRLAGALNVRPRDVGYAGLKDAQAVTRQWMSVEHVPAEKRDALIHDSRADFHVLETGLHTNKLKVGHLKGNRFDIIVRDVTISDNSNNTEPHRKDSEPDALSVATRIVQRISQTGIPNGYGHQRFGNKLDTHRVGKRMVFGDIAGALDTLIGNPAPDREREHIVAARNAYENGDYWEAMRLFPPSFPDERRALKALIAGKSKAGAFRAISVKQRQLFVNAYQAALFNRMLAVRIPVLNRVFTGDLAWLHRNGAVFSVDDPDVEQARADAGEISASLPMFGVKVPLAGGEPGRLEARLFQAEGLAPDIIASDAAMRQNGVRRPVRIPVSDAAVERVSDDPNALRFMFSLQAGGYATAVMSEIMKPVDRQAVIFSE